MTKLSVRAWQILLVIDEVNRPDKDGVLRYPGTGWYPGALRGSSDWCDRLGDYVNINGAGDARIIDSLTKKGLVKRLRNLHCYAAAITEDGHLAIERAMEQNAIPLELVK